MKLAIVFAIGLAGLAGCATKSGGGGSTEECTGLDIPRLRFDY